MSRLSGFSGRPEFPFRSSLFGKLLVALALLLGNDLRAEEQQSSSSISREVKQVFERSAKAVVKIHAADQHGELSGTGFFVDPTGTLYTSYSVGGEADNFTVEIDGKKIPARAGS